MKYGRFFISLVLGAAASFGLTADDVRWLSTEYDFGTFREADGKRTGYLKFVNKGAEPTVINRVRPTCGCTVAEYTEGEIAPGDTATVSFTYNPAGRPGRFLKHIKVYTGVDNRLSSLTIKGTVIGAPQTLATEYPVESGALRLSTDTLNMGHITMGSSRNEFIHGYNQSSDTLDLSWSVVPKAISLGVSSRKIAPGDIFTLSVYLNTAEGMELGRNDMRFMLHSRPAGEAHANEIPFTVTAYVDADFSSVTPEQMKTAPVVNLYPTVVELGTVTEKDRKIKVEVSVTNDGKSPLTVRRIYSPQIALRRATKTPMGIKPGKTAKIEVEIDGSLIPAGLFNIPIEVLTDDPLRQGTRFRLVGTRK